MCPGRCGWWMCLMQVGRCSSEWSCAMPVVRTPPATTAYATWGSVRHWQITWSTYRCKCIMMTLSAEGAHWVHSVMHCHHCSCVAHPGDRGRDNHRCSDEHQPAALVTAISTDICPGACRHCDVPSDGWLAWGWSVVLWNEGSAAFAAKGTVGGVQSCLGCSDSVIIARCEPALCCPCVELVCSEHRVVSHALAAVKVDATRWWEVLCWQERALLLGECCCWHASHGHHLCARIIVLDCFPIDACCIATCSGLHGRRIE